MTEKVRHDRLTAIGQRLFGRRLRRITNASLRCASNCTLKKPSDTDCAACQNLECVRVKAELDAFWQEVDAK